MRELSSRCCAMPILSGLWRKAAEAFVLPSSLLKTAVLVSGGGSNLQALLRAKEAGQLPDNEFVLVISSRPDVMALEHAQRRGIPSSVIDPRTRGTPQAFDEAMLSALEGAKTDLICLAGYLRRIG